MKRIEVTVRRISFGTLFRISFLSAFGFAFFLLAVALPFSRIDPDLTALRLIFGVIGLLTIWPFAVACGFSVGGWLLFALVGKKRKFRFTFVCDDQDSIPAIVAEPIKSATANALDPT